MVFNFEDYKAFIRDRFARMPNKGRGEFRKIAEFLGMHTTRVSHIFQGPENFTPEQAVALCNYLGLNEVETEYFLTLVQMERAGSVRLKEIFKRQLEQLKAKSTELKYRLPKNIVLSEEAKAVFYSNWFYSGIRLLTSIKGYNDIDTISQRLSLSKKTVSAVLEFLVSTGLCQGENGNYTMGPSRTHLESDSIQIGRLHTNWRVKAIEHYQSLDRTELAFTAPMSVNKSKFPVIREKLAKTIEEITQIVSKSEPEELACLNIDWFHF